MSMKMKMKMKMREKMTSSGNQIDDGIHQGKIREESYSPISAGKRVCPCVVLGKVSECQGIEKGVSISLLFLK